MKIVQYVVYIEKTYVNSQGDTLTYPIFFPKEDVTSSMAFWTTEMSEAQTYRYFEIADDIIYYMPVGELRNKAKVGKFETIFKADVNAA